MTFEEASTVVDLSVDLRASGSPGTTAKHHEPRLVMLVVSSELGLGDDAGDTLLDHRDVCRRRDWLRPSCIGRLGAENGLEDVMTLVLYASEAQLILLRTFIRAIQPPPTTPAIVGCSHRIEVLS